MKYLTGMVSGLVLLFTCLHCAEIERIFNIHYTPSPPVIDGQVTKEEWSRSDSIDGFTEVIPNYGAPPSVSTIGYGLYDENNLYFAFICYYPNPAKIVKDATTRDRYVGCDDYIQISLDTYSDHKNCYAFQINPIGTQQDVKIINNGEGVDASWDGKWTSVARITKDGWEIEIKIPFSTLQFQNKSPWGVNFYRGIPDRRELLSWCKLDMEIVEDVSSFGKLFGLEKIGMRRNYFITPYGISSWDTNWQQEINTGVDLAFKPVSNVKANVTFNPDFAQLEADVDQIDLSKLGIWLPEKRPFFLDGNDILFTPLPIMYTRSISKIAEGLKIMGNITGVGFNAFQVKSQWQSVSDCFSLRIKKDLFKSANWGTSFVLSRADSTSSIMSLDTYVPLLRQFSFTGQAVVSKVEANEDQWDKAVYLNLSQEPDISGVYFNLLYYEIGSLFVCQNGFMPFVDLIENDVGVGYKFFVNGSVLRSFAFTTDYARWENHQNVLINEGVYPQMNFDFQSRFSLSLSYDRYKRLFNNAYYVNSLGNATLVYAVGGQRSISVGYSSGNYYGSFMRYPQIDLCLNPFGRILTQISLAYQYLDYGVLIEQTKIFVIKFDYRINKPLSLRAFIQWSDISHRFDTNFLIQYEFFTGSHIYFAWNEGRDITNFDYPENTDLPLSDRKTLFKICYEFRF